MSTPGEATRPVSFGGRKKSTRTGEANFKKGSQASFPSEHRPGYYVLATHVSDWHRGKIMQTAAKSIYRTAEKLHKDLLKPNKNTPRHFSQACRIPFEAPEVSRQFSCKEESHLTKDQVRLWILAQFLVFLNVVHESFEKNVMADKWEMLEYENSDDGYPLGVVEEWKAELYELIDDEDGLDNEELVGAENFTMTMIDWMRSVLKDEELFPQFRFPEYLDQVDGMLKHFFDGLQKLFCIILVNRELYELEGFQAKFASEFKLLMYFQWEWGFKNSDTVEPYESIESLCAPIRKEFNKFKSDHAVRNEHKFIFDVPVDKIVIKKKTKQTIPDTSDEEEEESEDGLQF